MGDGGVIRGETGPAGQGGRNGQIDIMRGIAILLVLFHHFNIAYRLNDTALARAIGWDAVRAVARNGNYGVTMFFVISGYLITTNALKRWNDLRNIELILHAQLQPREAAIGSARPEQVRRRSRQEACNAASNCWVSAREVRFPRWPFLLLTGPFTCKRGDSIRLVRINHQTDG